MLGLAKRTNARIFQASTSGVYGNPHVHPQEETYWGFVNPIGPRSCYDEGKRCTETLFFGYNRQHKPEIKVARIFNTFGPGMSVSDGRVVSNFIVQAIRGEPFTLYGDGSQTRSFCYVDDLIDEFIKVMWSPSSLVRPYNLGNPVEYRMEELSSLILKLTDSDSEITHKDLPIDDPKQRQPDIQKAKRDLCWEPSFTLAEALARTIDYCRNELFV